MTVAISLEGSKDIPVLGYRIVDTPGEGGLQFPVHVGLALAPFCPEPWSGRTASALAALEAAFGFEVDQFAGNGMRESDLPRTKGQRLRTHACYLRHT